LVVSDSLNGVGKTKEAKAFLERVGAFTDVQKSEDSKKVRCGAGKARNRRYTQRRGPLVVFDVSEGLDRGFRNLAGVEVKNIDNLSLLDLAPGGHLGRFCIWTKGAFEKLDSLFGTFEEGSQLKNGFALPRPQMTNTDLARLINSDEIQSIVKAPEALSAVLPIKRNPVRNSAAKIALNPYHAEVKKRETGAKDAAKVKKAHQDKKARAKQFRARRQAFFATASKEGEVTF